MPNTQRHTDKRDVLRRQGVLNPHPQDVQDPLFQRHEFFDAKDLVQVKYEMLRRVRLEQQPIGAAAAAFGFSRPAFYQAQAAFAAGGLFGLVPRKRGSRQGHKLTPPIWDFIEQTRAADARRPARALAQQVAARFGVRIHPRSIERGLRSRQKNRDRPAPAGGSRGRNPRRSGDGL